MRIEIRFRGHTLEACPDDAVDLAIPQRFDAQQPSAFGLPHARAEAVAGEGWTLDTRRGGSVNCPRLTLIPHANGTHTECVAHIVDERLSLHALLHPSLLIARVLRVSPEPLGESGDTYGGEHTPEDAVISARALRTSLQAAGVATDHPIRPTAFAGAPLDPEVDAIVLGTQPVGARLDTRAWSGSAPAYFTDEAVALLRDCGYRHLLVDLPSVDREDDGGALAAHRGWWDLPPGVRSCGPEPSRRTITEMIDLPAGVGAGLYLLELQIPALAIDAAPSRPRISALRLGDAGDSRGETGGGE